MALSTIRPHPHSRMFHRLTQFFPFCGPIFITLCRFARCPYRRSASRKLVRICFSPVGRRPRRLYGWLARLKAAGTKDPRIP